VPERQNLVKPTFVKFHDGTGKAFLFLVTKEDDGQHLSGAVWCDDNDNGAGLSEGWNSRVQIGRNDDTLPIPGGASWSPFTDVDKDVS
jgi:hypothetical protein